MRSYSLHTVSNGTFPSKNIFFKDPDGCADIIGMSGYVIDGQLHPHITLASPDRAFGGHLEPRGNTVFTFAAVTLGIFGDDVNLEDLEGEQELSLTKTHEPDGREQARHDRTGNEPAHRNVRRADADGRRRGCAGARAAPPPEL